MLRFRAPTSESRSLDNRFDEKTLGKSGTTLYREFTDVSVPVCSACGLQQENAERFVNRIALSIMAICAIAAGIMAGFGAALVGFGFGWIGALIVQACFSGRHKSSQHPTIAELENDDWHFNHLYRK